MLFILAQDVVSNVSRTKATVLTAHFVRRQESNHRLDDIVRTSQAEGHSDCRATLRYRALEVQSPRRAISRRSDSRKSNHGWYVLAARTVRDVSCTALYGAVSGDPPTIDRWLQVTRTAHPCPKLHPPPKRERASPVAPSWSQESARPTAVCDH